MDQRLERLRWAATGALGRLHAVGWQLDPQALFAPLGETLMWTVALADALGVLEEDPYSGLAYARNCLVHGRSVTEVSGVATQPPCSHSPLKGDVPRITGSSKARIWGFLTEDPDPVRSDKPSRRRDAYVRSVAGHAMFPLLDRTLHVLGADVHLAASTELAPRSSSSGNRQP